MPADEASSPEAGRLAELRTSARGWHGVQLAVLGFIGLCGVLTASDSPAPESIQVLAGILALTALVLACLATYLVGRAAWPVYGPQEGVRAAGDAEELVRTSRRLTRGLILTFIAVGVLALSSAAGWWPSAEGEPGGGSVELQVGQASVCGGLSETRAGAVGVETAEGLVVVPIERLTAIRPVDRCE
jgi:hypothetical protein